MKDDLIRRQAAITLPVMPKEYREYQTFNLDDAYEQGWNDLQKCIELLPLAQPDQRWIPCDTDEPNTIGDYLLYRPHFWGANKGQVTVCYWNGHDWSDNYRNDAERYLPVISGMAWMPLPEPWKGEEDE